MPTCSSRRRLILQRLAVPAVAVLLLLSKPTTPTPYAYLSYDQMVAQLESFAKTYPTLATLKTSQDEFSLPTVGKCNSASDDCKNYYLTVFDAFNAGDELGNDDSRFVPDLFFSGEVHGDEAVGPLATLHAASLLLTAASCARAFYDLDDNAPDGGGAKPADAACATWFDVWRYNEDDMYHLAYLASSRRVVFSPMSNALGFSQKVRAENSIDPNRDFAFDVTDPKLCMRTVAARHINELFRGHLFQLAITFHGGMTAIAYEWGAPSRTNGLSPDDVAQSVIAKSMSGIGGTFSTEKIYPYDSMNDLVYPVNGGMEDWAYAGSWDTPLVPVGGCTPTTYGGYAPSKTVYTPSMLRAFNILVEANAVKRPSPSTLGDSLDVFNPKAGGNGHVPRNVRLTTLLIDVVQPYVQVTNVKDADGVAHAPSVIRNWDAVPGLRHLPTSCADRFRVSVPQSVKSLTVSWSVGGSFKVDRTSLYVSKGGWDTLAENPNAPDDGAGPSDVTCSTRRLAVEPRRNAKLDDADLFSHVEVKIEADNAGTRWSKPDDVTFRPSYTAVVQITDSMLAAGSFVIIPFASVDSHWQDKGSGAATVPNVAPQSHVVNARTRDDWTMSNAGKTVQGQTKWYGTPLTVVIATDGQGNIRDVGKNLEGGRPTMAPSKKGPHVTRSPTKRPTGGGGGGDPPVVGPPDVDDDGATTGEWAKVVLPSLGFLALLLLGVAVYWRRRRTGGSAAGVRPMTVSYEMVGLENGDGDGGSPKAGRSGEDGDSLLR